MRGHPGSCLLVLKPVCFRTTTKAERLQEYLAVGSLPDLTDAEVEEIEKTGSTLHKRFFVSTFRHIIRVRL